MPLDLGDDPARYLPACRLIVEVRVEPSDLDGRTPDRALKQVADPVLQDAVRREPDRILEPLGFEELVDIGIGKGGVGAKIEAREPCRDSTSPPAPARPSSHRLIHPLGSP